jgi:type II secretory ATPase GspE/PulE/Tfp pilus assembly ATPase PilB-like protein/putative methionine-R-sulfoxide reductase with GAF domain
MASAEASRVEELERQLRYNEKLKYVANKINSARNVTEILVQLQADILDLFEAERITIYAVDPVKKQLVSKYMVGPDIKEIRVPIGPQSISGYSAYSARLLNIGDVYDDAELKSIDPKLSFQKEWDQKTGFRSRSMLVVPIILEKRLMGVMQLINKRSAQPFTEQDEKNIREVARILGIAFNNQSKMTRSKFDYLLMHSIVTDAELKAATTKAREQFKEVETVLMEEYKVKKEDIGRTISEFYGCPFVEHSQHIIVDRSLFAGLNLSYLKRALWAPISSRDGKVTVVIDNPRDRNKTMEIKGLLRARDVEYQVALKDDIIKFLETTEKDAQIVAAEGVGANISEILAEMEIKEEASEDDLAAAEGGAVDENASTVVRLVNQIIIDANEKGASDIHVEPSKAANQTMVRFRIDGSCMKHLTIPFAYSKPLASRLKIMANLDISERRLPQDGKIKFMYRNKTIELRVATLPTVGGEDVVMRILASSEPMPLEKLNLSPRNFKEFVAAFEKPYGIILVVGPTGSGKTTTLHAGVGHINTVDRKIWTAEDPVEITQEGLRQVEVKPKIDFTFARAMRAFLRADPDVIMVGEMRDHETAAIGIEASLTGHLVLSTLHTNSAPETITRLIDMDIDPFNFADALIAILAQRLVRTLCKKCKEAYHPEREEFDQMVTTYGPEQFLELGIEYTNDLKLFRPKGCPDCNHTGYRGRTGLHEILVGTDEIKAVISRKSRVDEIRAQAVADGMRTLFQDGIMKVFKGDTDIKMVRSVCIK